MNPIKLLEADFPNNIADVVIWEDEDSDAQRS